MLSFEAYSVIRPYLISYLPLCNGCSMQNEFHIAADNLIFKPNSAFIFTSLHSLVGTALNLKTCGILWV